MMCGMVVATTFAHHAVDIGRLPHVHVLQFIPDVRRARNAVLGRGVLQASFGVEVGLLLPIAQSDPKSSDQLRSFFQSE